MSSWFLRRVAIRSALAVALVAFGAACRTTPPSTAVPYSQMDLVVGTGTTAAAGQTLSVDYTGYMYDSSKPDGRGPVFDTSVGRGEFVFVLDKSNVIQGWVVGVPGMKEGGTRRLVIPPELAYDGQGTSTIPANATLVFDITLHSIQQ